MPPLLLLYILFGVGGIAGALRARRLIHASRLAGQWPDAIYTWSGPPLSPLRYEPYAVTAIMVHTLTGVALGFMALQVAGSPGLLSNPLLVDDFNMIVLGWFIQCGCQTLVGYLLGQMLIAFPLIILRREPIAHAVTPGGFATGRTLLPWNRFSYFAIDPEGGILKFYSTFAPDLPAIVAGLPDQVSRAALEQTLRGLLPMQPPPEKGAWYRTKTMLMPAMLGVCLVVGAVGWLAAGLTKELALFGITVLMVILIFLGGRIIETFAFGVHRSGKRSAGSSRAA